jgi:ClpP class serine protease
MWLLNEETARMMQRAHAMNIQPTAVQLEAFTQRIENAQPRNMTVAGSVAEIRVQGVLTKMPDFWATYFGGGGTAYSDIIAALALAKSDASIKEVVLVVDSPGGNSDGLFDTLAAISDFKATKKMSVSASNALSAAYAIAAMGGKITATGPHACFGSIGTACDFNFYDQVTTVSLTNTDSPEKRPDVQTAEGKAVVVKFLDSLNDLFVEAIAKGRGGDVTAKSVIADYGRGATLLAADAKKRGMIDGIAKPLLRAVTGVPEQPDASGTTAGGAEMESEMTMDLKTLRATHPQLCDELVREGRASGVSEERDRVSAHLTLAAHGGEPGMKIALAAIEAGDGITMKTQAQYFSLAMNAQQVKSRQDESNDSVAVTAAAAGVVTADAAAQGPKKDIGDLVADRVAPLAQKAG